MHRQLDENTLVSGQIRPDDVPALKELGVTLIVNNRPDNEDVGQPESDDIDTLFPYTTLFRSRKSVV